jgi:transcriptional regulator with XRE-family HTH domain
MADKVNAKVARWGMELRRQREISGHTQGDLANLIRYSKALVSGWERGTRQPKLHHIQALDTALATGGALVNLWSELSEIKEIPKSWRSFIELERQAAEIREYQPLLIPGLLQCADYARALIGQSGLRPADTSMDELVSTRLERRGKLLADVRLWFVIEETAIRRVVGSRGIQRQALDHLMDVAELRNVRLTVVPEYAPQRPGLAGSFRVMRLPDGRSVAHVEHVFGEAVINDNAHLNELLTSFGDLQTESLTPSASLELIRKVRDEVDELA